MMENFLPDWRSKIWWVLPNEIYPLTPVEAE